MSVQTFRDRVADAPLAMSEIRIPIAEAKAVAAVLADRGEKPLSEAAFWQQVVLRAVSPESLPEFVSVLTCADRYIFGYRTRYGDKPKPAAVEAEEKHKCGLQGFDPMAGDVGCEQLASEQEPTTEPAPVEEEPLYRCPWEGCVFLGRFDGADLYFAASTGGAMVVAQLGPGIRSSRAAVVSNEYTSEQLAEADRRARERGLIPARQEPTTEPPPAERYEPAEPPEQPENQDGFAEHLEQASETVQTWPAWKQAVLDKPEPAAEGSLSEESNQGNTFRSDICYALSGCTACLPASETWAATDDGVVQYIRDIVATVQASRKYEDIDFADEERPEPAPVEPPEPPDPPDDVHDTTPEPQEERKGLEWSYDGDWKARSLIKGCYWWIEQKERGGFLSSGRTGPRASQHQEHPSLTKAKAWCQEQEAELLAEQERKDD